VTGPGMRPSAHDEGDRRRRLRSQEVYQRLRRDITALRLAPGTVLQEAALSDRYQASRTPVREALFRLHQEGFVDKRGRQLRVKTFTFADVEELYELREALEKMAVRLCVARAPEAELRALDRELDRYVEFDPETETNAFNEHANRFHRAVAHLSGNRLIESQLDAIHDKVMVISVRYLARAHSFEQAQREHAMILRAVWDRDVVVAEAAVRHHIQGVVALYRQSNAAAAAGREGDADNEGPP